MGWATGYIARLGRGETVSFRPRGDSMRGKINSGDLVTVAPAGDRALAVGDIVLCKVAGSQYLHLIKAIRGAPGEPDARYQIGNNRGRINGWVGASSIYGVVTRVEP
ncbi:MAG: S24/S26 family peptidase, partial [Myxococcales bacterium]|nr:S24/S26 family peptidase [Myxococcales bacterium]